MIDILSFRFMPCLKYIVQNADNKDYKLLRGKTIECISLIGLAVGQQKVGFKMQESCNDTDDNDTDFVVEYCLH